MLLYCGMHMVQEATPHPGITRRARLVDVARMAGVAPNTASTILNRRPNSWASEQTKQRVFNAARALGYRPSRSALGLRLGTFYRISLIVPDLSDPNCAAFAHHSAAPIRKLGYHACIEESGRSPSDEERARQRLHERDCDGAILLLRRCQPDSSPMASIPCEGPRVLITMHEIPESNDDQVVLSPEHAMAGLLDDLATRGHKHVALLRDGSEEDPACTLFCRMLAERSGICLAPEPATEDALDFWLSMSPPNRPTAIIAGTDAAALRTLARARASGIDVPRQLSVLTLEGGSLAGLAHLPLAGLQTPVEQICGKAAMLLIKRIQGHPEAPPERLKITLKFSTAGSLGSTRRRGAE